MTVFTITSLQAEDLWLNLPRILNIPVEQLTESPVWIILRPGCQGGKGRYSDREEFLPHWAGLCTAIHF